MDRYVIELTVDYKFVRTGTLLCDKNISSALPYCIVLFLTKNKLASTINNFLGWQNSDLHFASSLTPAKIQI